MGKMNSPEFLLFFPIFTLFSPRIRARIRAFFVPKKRSSTQWQLQERPCTHTQAKPHTQTVWCVRAGERREEEKESKNILMPSAISGHFSKSIYLILFLLACFSSFHSTCILFIHIAHHTDSCLLCNSWLMNLISSHAITSPLSPLCRLSAFAELICIHEVTEWRWCHLQITGTCCHLSRCDWW